jgi:hypothetical protein
MVTLNAAALYRFDLDVLRPIADLYGPTVREIATPIVYADIPLDAQMCPAFAPENQRVAA